MKLITTIMEENTALKTKLAEIVAIETRKRSYNRLTNKAKRKRGHVKILKH